MKKQAIRNSRKANKSVSSIIAASMALSILATPVLSLTTVATADSTSSYVTLNSFSGHPGVKLTVSGGNFLQNEAIIITAAQNGNVVANVQTTADQIGQFSAAVQLPVKLAQGAVTITATGQKSHLSSTNSYYSAPFSPSLTAADSQTTPYSTIAVSGTGYAPNEVVDLNLAGSVATAQTDANGAFTNASVATPNVPAASYTIVGAGEASGASAVAYEYVNAFYPSVSPNSYYVMPITSLGFNGSGFAANETIVVRDVTTNEQVSSFKADKSGSFKNAGSFTVPGSYAGLTKKFSLTGSTSQATTTTSTVVGKYYPSVSPTKYYVSPGGVISFNGSGFVPGETVTITSGGVDYGTVKADSKGNLTAAGAVQTDPSQAGKTVNFTLTGQTSQGSGSVGVQVGNYNPQASPSDYYVMPGGIVTFSGNGYAPNEVVAVFSGQDMIGSFNTDTAGAFKAQGNVSIAYNQANSGATYKLVGGVSNQPISFSISVGQLNTQLTPSSYYVLPYAPFDVTVTGFAPNEKVTLSDGSITTTNNLGKATFKNISLPYTGKSSATLTATGAISTATATASIGIGNYNPTVTASNYYAKPGTTDTLSGTGFAPNEAVTITAGKLTQTVSADPNGTFTTDIVLPFSNAKNSLTITSTGSLSKASATTGITLAPYNPQVTPSTYYATPGTDVTFTGSGFVPGEQVSVGFANKGGIVIADAKGNLPSGFALTLPYGAKSATVYISGDTSGATTTITIGLAQFYAGVQLSNYYGNGGSTVTASGSGYAPNEQIVLTSGSTKLATATTDKNGAFSQAIAIPYAAPGKLPVTATGQTSQAAATTSYTVAQVYNSVGLASYAVPAGKAVTITGSGFFPNEPITVTTDRTGTTYSFKADSKGNLQDSGLVLPANLKEGKLTLTIIGTYSYTSHDITMYVQSANAQ